MIGSLSVVKSLLGIATADTSKDAVLTAIIAAADDWIELACNRQFSQDNYVFQENGTGDRYLRLPHKPVNGVCWSAYGDTGVITVTYSGSSPGQISVHDKTVTVCTGLTRTDVDLTSSSIITISDAAAAIDALTDWGATASTLYGTYPALCLLDRVYDYRLSTSGSFELVGAVNPMDMRRVQDGVYRVYSTIYPATTMLIIYNGGYSTYPDGLIYAASKIAADAYSTLLRDGLLQEERLGDYMYKLGASVSTSAVQSNWDLLLPYANISL